MIHDRGGRVPVFVPGQRGKTWFDRRIFAGKEAWAMTNFGQGFDQMIGGQGLTAAEALSIAEARGYQPMDHHVAMEKLWDLQGG